MNAASTEEFLLEVADNVHVLAQPDMVDFIAKSDLPVLKQISAARMAVQLQVLLDSADVYVANVILELAVNSC